MNQSEIHELAIKALNSEIENIRVNLVLPYGKPLATVQDIIEGAKLLQQKLDQIEELKSR